jgi:hypothetical protein
MVEAHPMKHKRDIILQFCSNPDAVLNALHQEGWQVVPKSHDEQVRKPLVDALEWFALAGYQRARKALAKVKEQDGTT